VLRAACSDRTAASLVPTASVLIIASSLTYYVLLAVSWRYLVPTAHCPPYLTDYVRFVVDSDLFGLSLGPSLQLPGSPNSAPADILRSKCSSVLISHPSVSDSSILYASDPV
jgi:hypothetical protein